MLAVAEKQPVNINFPRKLAFLLREPARIKVAYGGRGAGKTVNAIRAAIVLSRLKYLEIVCGREFQNSIQASLYDGIVNEIVALGFEHEFDILKVEIVHKITGSRFTFEGLRYNISKIKSRARIDIFLIDEADTVSKNSLDILFPTIRSREYAPGDFGGPFGKGPEIWIFFNPNLDTDEVYKRFVLNKDKFAPDFDKDGNRYAFVTKINHSDNPWFPPDLEREMLLLKEADEDDWLHVWEGNTKQTLDGAIFTKEIKKVLLDGRRGKVSYDPTRPVHTFWDLGHSDHTAIWFVQQVGMEYNIISYFQDHLQKIGYYLSHLQTLGYVYGNFYMPHDAENETLASMSIEKIVRKAGFKVIIVPRVARKVIGINASRTIFDLCNFDEENTSDGWQCLCRYQYAVNEQGQFSREPAHNEYSHGADAFQTFALSLKSETAIKKPKPEPVSNVVPLHGINGWMGG